MLSCCTHAHAWKPYVHEYMPNDPHLQPTHMQCGGVDGKVQREVQLLQALEISAVASLPFAFCWVLHGARQRWCGPIAELRLHVTAKPVS
jgi:hypothetical protein